MIIYADGPYSKLAAQLDGTANEIEEMTSKHVGFRVNEVLFFRIKALADVTNTTASDIMRDLLDIGIDQLNEHLDTQTREKALTRFSELVKD